MISPYVAGARQFVAPIVLCSVLLACSDDPAAPQPVPEHAITLTYCASAAPSWLAFRDGDGSWTREFPEKSGAQVAFHHVFTSDDAAVASVAPAFGNAFTVVRVLYGTPDELATEGDTTAIDCVVDGAKTLRGTVEGLDTTQLALITVGPGARSSVHPRLGVDFTVEGLPSGLQDLLAARTTNGPLPTRLILRRDIDLPSGALIPSLDFESQEAFDVATANVTIENLGADAAVNSTILTTPHGRFTLPFLPAMPTRTMQSYTALPPNRLLVGDLEQLHVSTGATFRTADVFFRSLVDRTVILGEPLVTPTITAIASDAPLRVRARFVAQADYGQLTSVVFEQPAMPVFVVVSMTAASAVRTGYDLDIPDLSAVPGFDAAWALRPGLPMTWTASRVGGTVPIGRNPIVVNGATRRTVTAQGTLTLP